MSFLKKLFQRPLPLEPEPTTPSASQSPAPTDPAQDPNMIRVFDGYGRELYITREQWRTQVLIPQLEKSREQPDTLYQTILQSLHDGFLDDIVEATEHLAQIDPIPERGATLLSIVYLKKQRLDEAERVLREFIARHGETGIILTNLAKIHAARQDDAQTHTTLWRALELDPNQDNALAWFESLEREKNSPAAGLAALRRIATLPGSWRARLWLAKEALDRRQLDEALSLYRDALAMAGSPAPADLLTQMSGDLGNAAHLPELLALTEPHFRADLHGIQVGNNLLKANLDLARFETVRQLLDQLYAQKRPDWKPTLDYWESELAKARLSTVATAPDGHLEIAMLHGDGPVWLPPASPASELFPAATTDEPLRVAFLGCTGEKPMSEKTIEATFADAPGRLSRALPLFLAEHTFFNGNAKVRPLVAWARGEPSAFIFCAAPWKEDDAAQQARRLDPPADYIVITHLKVTEEPWRAELRLIRTIDAQLLGSATAEFSLRDPEQPLRRLADEMLGLLHEHAGLEPATPPPHYTVPHGAAFGHYLIRLEQLLSVRCYTADPSASNELHGEREIIDGDIELCLLQPANVVPRLLLAQTLKRLGKIRPEVVAEYRDKIALLEKQHPLPPPAGGIVHRLFSELYP
jgi:tetratricopeptide (TPR) repeat protein